MANYQAVTLNLGAPISDFTKPVVIPGAGAGARIVAWSLVTLPTLYLDGAGLCTLGICIGGFDARPIRLRDGMRWAAPLGRNLLPIPETGGLFIVSLLPVGAIASIKGVEFVIEFEPQELR